MMKKFFVIILLFSTFFSSAQRVKTVDKNLQRPKLVVGLVIDQMRWDYLYRYYNRFGDNGFKRLLQQGFSCENTLINHLPSYTAVGHATIYTGSIPAVHGITGNDWIEEMTGRKMYCTGDTAAQTVGSASVQGKMSPRNLLATTITDELLLATNFQSKVVSVSLKDRASIIPGGHHPNGAFWLDDASGNFITSSYYMKDLPDWVKQFNEKKEPAKLVANSWNTLQPIQTYTQSEADNVAWEDVFKGEKLPVFPHNISENYKSNPVSLRSTPFGNTLTIDFAKAAVEGYNLGSGNFTDFLTINCASTDYVGHMYGPNSIEVEDTYLRLDKELASFFSYLDSRVGKGQYLLFLTADHGAAHAKSFLESYNFPANFISSSKLVNQLNQQISKTTGFKDLIRSGMNYQIHFDKKKILQNHLNYDSLKKVVVEFLQQQPGIQFAIDVENIGLQPIPEPLKQMVINGYNSRRSGSIAVIPEPGWFETHTTGTSHGTWYLYDTHIPLIFMGWQIEHGKTNKVVHMTDIAPTVAALLHIQMPSGCVGKPIEEVIESK